MRRSVVIPTRQRASLLHACLEAVKAQTTQADEVIVTGPSGDLDARRVVDTFVGEDAPRAESMSRNGATFLPPSEVMPKRPATSSRSLDDDAEPEASNTGVMVLDGSVGASSHVVDLRTIRGHLRQRRCCSPRGSDRRPALNAVAR